MARTSPGWLVRRREIAAHYDLLFAGMPWLEPVRKLADRDHAYHIYVVALNLDRLNCDRDTIFQELRASGIGANVHYKPVHLHSYYRERLGCREGLCPAAEAAYQRIVTLPLFPAMSDSDIQRVVDAIETICSRHAA